MRTNGASLLQAECVVCCVLLRQAGTPRAHLLCGHTVVVRLRFASRCVQPASAPASSSGVVLRHGAERVVVCMCACVHVCIRVERRRAGEPRGALSGHVHGVEVAAQSAERADLWRHDEVHRLDPLSGSRERCEWTERMWRGVAAGDAVLPPLRAQTLVVSCGHTDSGRRRHGTGEHFGEQPFDRPDRLGGEPTVLSPWVFCRVHLCAAGVTR